MTIVSIKSGTGTEFRRLELSDGSFFSFKTCYLPPVFVDESLYTPGTAEGREISAGEEAGFRFAAACLRVERAALRLVARAEQCFFGLSRKLERRGCDSACVRLVLARLAELELVDDCRFARLWLETRLQRAGSPRRLRAGLHARGIDRNDAAAALQAILDTETDSILLDRFVRKQRRLRRGRGVADQAGGDPFRSLKFALKNEGFSTAAIQRFLEAEQDAGTGTMDG
jgi:SOS response regulatory protein OraA/RecX